MNSIKTICIFRNQIEDNEKRNKIIWYFHVKATQSNKGIFIKSRKEALCQNWFQNCILNLLFH
jgi:hypothetical protein